MLRRFIFTCILFALLAFIPFTTSAQTPNPWDTPIGQQCFEKWIAESMAKLNAYDGRQDFNLRKPWSINQYGILEGFGPAGPRSIAPPDDFKDHNYNKYWEMWDLWTKKGPNVTWGNPEWDGAGIEDIRSYVTRCVGASGGSGTGTGGAGGGGSGGGNTGGGNTGAASALCLQELETRSVSATTGDPVVFNTVLQQGQSYAAIASGVFSFWRGQDYGIDALYRYDSPFAKGQPPELWSPLVINDRGIQDWLKDAGASLEYRSDHVYAIGLKGDGKPLAIRIADGAGYADNSGSATVKLCTASSVNPPGGTGITNFPPVPETYGCTTSGTTINAIDGDPENQLQWCDNRVPFGDESSDKGRCFTFRYQVPPGGVKSALLRMSIKPVGDADTDDIVAAAGSSQSKCGNVPCVLVHGGLAGHSNNVEIDLMNNGCDRDIQVAEEAVQPLASQLNTGVLHVRLQDDTAVYGAQLLLNCSPTCKIPPTGSGEPNTNVSGMTIQAAKRSVIEGQTVLIPVWLIKANNVANINYEITYNGSVVRIEGKPSKGNLLDNALFSANPNDSGILRAGFAQTSGLSGTGTVTNIPFRAVGRPGDRTTLEIKVTTINDPNGGVPQIDRINGEIVILNQDGTLPGGGSGGGSGGSGGGSTGAIPRGDCDGDSKLTESDALCALEMSVQLRPVLAIMDMDGNGTIDSRDAVIILQRVMSGG